LPDLVNIFARVVANLTDIDKADMAQVRYLLQYQATVAHRSLAPGADRSSLISDFETESCADAPFELHCECTAELSNANAHKRRLDSIQDVPKSQVLHANLTLSTNASVENIPLLSGLYHDNLNYTSSLKLRLDLALDEICQINGAIVLNTKALGSSIQLEVQEGGYLSSSLLSLDTDVIQLSVKTFGEFFGRSVPSTVWVTTAAITSNVEEGKITTSEWGYTVFIIIGGVCGGVVAVALATGLVVGLRHLWLTRRSRVFMDKMDAASKKSRQRVSSASVAVGSMQRLGMLGQGAFTKNIVEKRIKIDISAQTKYRRQSRESRFSSMRTSTAWIEPDGQDDR